MRRLIILVFVLTLSTSLFASFIFSEYNATPETNRVILSWVTKTETNISHFAVLRSNDDRTYAELKKINILGPGTRYTFIDENVMFKDNSALFYKIKAIDKNGQSLESTDAMIVHPNISGIFRTWGAIKAMFR